MGLLFTKYGHFNRYSELISNRDGILVTVFVWILAAVLSAVPYAVLGYLDPVSAYFEAMSGLTTVGATVISDVEAWPKSLLFWRFWTHWLGGLGIIVIFLAILPTISGSAVHLFNAESTGFEEGKLKPKLKNTAQILFGIYLGLTVAAAVLDRAGGETRTTARKHDGRGPYCHMGVCYECLMEIDGVPNQQSCLIPVREGMSVKRQSGAPSFRTEENK